MNLKELRKNEKLTQTDIAKILNVAKSTYCGYELGSSEPTLETLIKLADYYGVSLDYLVGREFKNDVGYMSPEQKEVVKMFLKLDEFNQAKVTGYITGLSMER